MNARWLALGLCIAAAVVGCNAKSPSSATGPSSARSLAAVDAPAGSGRRVALIIGNSRYESGPLANPANDAELIGRTLKELGFAVSIFKNSNQEEMKRAIKEFGRKLEEAGPTSVGLFYYAGHGLQIDGRNFLVPVNAHIERDADAEIESVGADWVMDQMRFAGNHLNFIILDACRNNPFTRTSRSAAAGLAKMDAPEGVLISYSTAPGSVAEDGAGANSPYTEALARAMRDSRVPAELMFKQARNDVVRATNRRQVPWDASSLTGQDFYFVAPEASPAIAAKVDSPTVVSSGAAPASRGSPNLVAANGNAPPMRGLSAKLPPAPMLGGGSRCDNIPGEWRLENATLAGTARFNADHTVTTLGDRTGAGSQGTWKCDGSNLGVVIQYANNVRHQLDMDVTSRNMLGRDQDGQAVMYRR